MPIIVDGKSYYRTTEACRTIGVSRNTLFRWLMEDDFDEAEYRDWRGWRLIPEAQVKRLKQKTSQIMVKSKKSERAKEPKRQILAGSVRANSDVSRNEKGGIRE